MKQHSNKALIIVYFAAAMMLTSCGGGGGGGGSSASTASATVSFVPSTLTTTYFQNQTAFVNSYSGAPDATVTATFGGTLPTGTVYPVITLDHAYFTNVGVIQSGINTYTGNFTPDKTLAPGTYTGVATLQLFRDSAHTSLVPLTGGTLPYSVTVTPELKITVKIDGVVSSTIKPSSSNAPVTMINGNTIYWYNSSPASVVTLHAGQLLELTSTIPVNWTGPGSLYPYGYLWAAPVVTSTSFQQVIAAPPSGSSSLTNNPFIAMPVSGNQWGAGFNIDITN